LDSFTFLDDSTGELNALSSTGVGPYELVEVPVQGSVPPSGKFFSMGVTTFSTGATTPTAAFTAGAFSNPTTSTAGALLTNLNNQLATNGVALNLSNCGVLGSSVLSTLPSDTVCSNPIDPSSIAVSWDANTSQYLANFGLVDVGAAVPEPGSFALLGTVLACVGVLRLRRRVSRS